MFDRYSVIDMFGPVYGENWHSPELHDGLTYRWSHPYPSATLVIPTLNALQARLRIILAHPPDLIQLNQLVLTVAGEPKKLRWSMKGPLVNLWTEILFEQPASSVQITISVPPRSSVLSTDTRQLGLAVNRVEVFAIEEGAVGVQNQDLQDQIRVLQMELKALRQRPSSLTLKERLTKALNLRDV